MPYAPPLIIKKLPTKWSWKQDSTGGRGCCGGKGKLGVYPSGLPSSLHFQANVRPYLSASSRVEKYFVKSGKYLSRTWLPSLQIIITLVPIAVSPVIPVIRKLKHKSHVPCGFGPWTRFAPFADGILYAVEPFLHDELLHKTWMSNSLTAGSSGVVL